MGEALTEPSQEEGGSHDREYDELTDPGYDYALDGGTNGNPTGNAGTGHFTQVVWKATTKLGCGVKHDPGDFRAKFRHDRLAGRVDHRLGLPVRTTRQPTRARARISPHHSRTLSSASRRYIMAGNWGFDNACSFGDEMCFEKNVLDGGGDGSTCTDSDS